MTRAMAREVGDHNICVNTVCPGFVVTEGRQVDPAFNASRVANRALKRVQVENDLVGTVLFLASPESDLHDRAIAQRRRRCPFCRITAFTYWFKYKDSKMRFENKSVVITGGGGKIGKAYAMAFAKEGAKVSLPDVASADPVVRAIKDMGVNGHQ